MNELAERRKLLLRETELHRSLIGLERVRLQARLAALNQARARVATGGPWLVAGGAIAGLYAVRHWRTLSRWLPNLFSMAWLARKLILR